MQLLRMQVRLKMWIKWNPVGWIMNFMVEFWNFPYEQYNGI